MKSRTPAPATKPSAKHQRLKIALIPVLLLVLAYVVFAPPHTHESTSDTPISSVLATINPTQPAASVDAPPSTRAWPEANLQFLSSASPFKSIAAQASGPTSQRFVSAHAQPVINEADHLADVASDLGRRPVNFVFHSSKKHVIMLGDEILEKGSHLSPAVQLHDIQDNALLLRLHP